MRLSFELLNEAERNQVHRASLAVLARTGMRIDSPGLLEALRAAGARVDAGSNHVRFPETLVEGALEANRRRLEAGGRLHLLNGVTSEIKGEGRILAKISGGCEHFLDWESQSLREGETQSLLSFIRLGELLPEVDFVGNPVVLRRGPQGEPIEERMRRVETAALVAKNTRKVGSMEVWDQREIDLFVEMGTVVRGSLEAYYSEPCLVTAKETISPLYLDGNSGDILLALARRQLPCTIIPMPITGMSAPVSMLGSLVIGNAEILGVMSAIKAAVPDALVGGGSISGLLDMRSGTASFGAPEAILQDIALAEVHEKLYGFNYLIGAGYTDAKLPNSQTLVEKTLKFLLTCLARRHTYPVGLINGGSVFSAEQALVDLEICRNIHAQLRPIGGFEAIEEIVDLIDRAGIRGHFLETEHTRVRFRENWLPELLDRSGFASIEHSRSRELYRAAHEQAGQLLGRGDFWQIEREKARAIDEIVARARRNL